MCARRSPALPGRVAVAPPGPSAQTGVAVRVFRPRQGLAIGLQAIAHVVEQFGDPDLVPLALQCRVDARSCRSSAAGTRDPHGWSAPPASKSSRKLGSCSTVRFRPPPGWRMRPFAAPTAGWPNFRGESSREKLRWPLQLPGHHARPPTPQRQAPAAAPARPQRGQSLGNELESPSTITH